MDQEGPPVSRRKKKVSSPPSGTERHHETREQALRALVGDIDPLKHAGEGQFATDEYFPQDIAHNPHLLGDVNNPEAYYPGPELPRRKR